MSCPPCPPPMQEVCAPPPQPPVCRVKPIMRGLHWAQTKKIIAQALALAAFNGFCYYFFVGRRRRAAYKEFYENAELEEWADEMARMGLFQAVPMDSLKDYCKTSQ